MTSARYWLPFLLVGLAAWYGLWFTDTVSHAVLPAPHEVFVAFPALFSARYMPDIASTISRSLAAFFLSIPLGILAGYITFAFGPYRQPAETTLDFLRSIPATALVPFFIVAFGVGDSAKVAVGAFSSTLVIALATIVGLHNRNATRVGVARLLRLSAPKRILLLDLPESLSHIFIGLRAGVSLALILVVVSEMFIGSNRGLGRVINDLRFTDSIPTLYGALIVTGIIGYGFNWSLQWVERLLVHWRGQ